MNIQIFGTAKSFDTKKAQRFFSDRKIKVQFIDLREKGISKGELNSVISSVGGLDRLVDENCKDKELLSLFRYISDEAKLEKVLENQKLLKMPIVRNGRQATVGYAPDIWKSWE